MSTPQSPYWKMPAELGIVELTREQYLKRSTGLVIHSMSSPDANHFSNPQPGDVHIVSVCRPGHDKHRLSFVQIGSRFIFSEGEPWDCTPLVPRNEPERDVTLVEPAAGWRLL